ncbi:DUF4383 domain-containing protein [Pseudonocardia sp. ICBG1293]|uniref:DUF4383 domain-containing protein n=1 Tax=Pseudonocardia sp. ICBG1293 TaxID=2844382 RepID=UPI001CC9C346|nr:DUF4383 domain-containing protein [Pseudonocardia sp. ICBG1293]
MSSIGSDARRLNGLHRVSSALVGIVLLVFGALGLTDNLDFFSTTGSPVLGLSTNLLLSTVSLVVGALLVGAAARGERFASTVSTTVGALFLLSGVVNVLLIGTPYNVLAFRMPNVVFSLLVGLVMLVLGAYGRFSGRLPSDNPYAAEQKHVVDAEGGDDRDQRLPSGASEVAAARSLAETERLVANGEGTDEQRRMLAEVDAIRDLGERRAAWRSLTERGSAPA